MDLFKRERTILYFDSRISDNCQENIECQAFVQKVPFICENSQNDNLLAKEITLCASVVVLPMSLCLCV